MDACLCVCSWMCGQRRELIFSIFDQLQIVKKVSFVCQFWCEYYTKSCACVNLRDRK